jgi:hypothetical protein
MWDPNISQPYMPPQPVMGIALLYFALLYFIVWQNERYVGKVKMDNINIDHREIGC